MYVDPLLLFSSGHFDHLIFMTVPFQVPKLGTCFFSIIPPQSVSLALCGQKVKSAKLATFTQSYFYMVADKSTTTKIINIIVSPPCGRKETL